MLSDNDLEAVLRRYRVGDPSSDLGNAVRTASTEVPHRFEWVWGPATASAVLAIWIVCHLTTTDSPIDPVRAQEVAVVTELLGGDENAAAYAEIVVSQSPQQGVQTTLTIREEPWPKN